MSLNTAHANGGVLIHSGEYILIFTDNVTMEFSGQSGGAFNNTKQGRMYLTTHRMIFNNKDSHDMMQSFSFPFITISDVELEQPIFGANYIKGKVRAQPNGNWSGEAKFKIYFKSGGAIEFGQAMLRAAHMAQQNFHSDAPPPYTASSDPWYQAPPSAYAPPPAGFGFTIPTNVFPQQPPQDDAKAAEAAQSAYYDPNRPQMAYVPPPAYYEKPPNYQDSNKKND